MTRPAILAVAVLATLAVDARADEGPPGLTAPQPAVAATAAAPPPTPRWMLTVGGLVRATGHDPGASAEIEALEAYGWYAHAAPLTGLRADLAYTRAPIVDLGAAVTWGRGTFAAGPFPDDPDHLVGSAVELGAFARVRWVPPRSPVSLEPRLEVGVTRTAVSLRGESTQTWGTYSRIGLDARIGGRRAGVLLGVDRTVVRDGGGMDAPLDVPTGGITFALSFYWRQWR